MFKFLEGLKIIFRMFIETKKINRSFIYITIIVNKLNFGQLHDGIRGSWGGPRPPKIYVEFISYRSSMLSFTKI
jgi:hypothetical protein